MAKANNTNIYKYNEYPSLLDYLFGTDFEDYKKNKSFRLNSIIQLINNVNGVNNTQFIFSDGSDSEVTYFDKGYFFTDNNETNPNGFTKIILNKESLQPIDLTLLFERLATIGNLVLRLDNPSNLNNFFNFNINSITDEGNFFVFEVEPFENFFFGELINSTVYSVYFDVKANISDKLSRGGYLGTAKDLDDRINSVEFPNEILIHGPVLLENGSVSISANDFTVRINQTVVSNPSDYNVVINPATQGFNRTDIIIIDQNGLFTKIEGQESADVAVKPVPSLNTLEITSINVLGNTIFNPTPSDNSKLDRGGYTGTAKDLDNKINQISLPDQVTKDGVITTNGLNITVNQNEFNWRINTVEFTNTPSFYATLDAATNNFFRSDLLQGNNLGQYSIKKGVQGEFSSTAPEPDTNCIAIKVINIQGSNVSPPVPLPDFNALYFKRFKQTFKTLQPVFDINPNEDDYNIIFINTAPTVVKIYPNGSYGKFIKNNSTHPLKSLGSSTVTIQPEPGVTLNAPNGVVLNKGQQCYLIKDDNNEWTLVNPLTINLNPYSEFQFVQKGFGKTGPPGEVGDIYCGWSNDGTIRISEGSYNGGSKSDSNNFTPIVQTSLI